MKAVLRVDASLAIGTGHVMRCRTLALALRAKGAQVGFVCRQHDGHLCGFLEGEGFDVIRLPGPVAGNRYNVESSPVVSETDWLGASWEVDAEETRAALQNYDDLDWLVVDHYGIDASWEAALRPAARRIMAIDDLENRRHDCDLLLDSNPHRAGREHYDGLVPERCTKLLGPMYALLRPEFWTARQVLRPRDGRVSRLLVFFGGVDLTNETTKAIHAIRALGRTDLSVDLVVGGTNPHIASIERACELDRSFRIHHQVANLSQLMADADLAIGAGGGAVLERCSLALPSIVMSVAPNQVGGCAELQRLGAIRFLGDSREVRIEALTESIREALHSPEVLARMAGCGARLVDAGGTDRVIERLLRGPMVLRRAVSADCESLWVWRNAEITRRHSSDSSPIAPSDHRRWFDSVLKDPCRDLLVGEDDYGAVGVVRFDTDVEDATISVYLANGRHGKGLGAQLIQTAADWIRVNRPTVRTVVARIQEENLPSIRAFSRVGFNRNGHLYTLDLLGTGK